MKTPKAALAVTAAIVVLVGGAGAIAGLSSANVDGRTEERRAAVMTTFAGLTPPVGEPHLPGIDDAAPAAGTVGEVAGPFDDRFDFLELRFDGGSVSGAIEVTSDISEVLELEIIAGFYDASGSLIGSGTFVLDSSGHDAGHAGAPDEHHDFAVAVPPELTGQAVSAAVGVPVLVNE